MSVTRLKNLIHELDAFLDELADHSTLENQLELLRQTQVLILYWSVVVRQGKNVQEVFVFDLQTFILMCFL